MHARGLLLMVSLFFISQIATAQTRKIAHRSHSGARATFAMLMDEDHLGGPLIKFPNQLLIRETYHLEPWIDSLHRHYEANIVPITPKPTPNAEPIVQPEQAIPSNKDAGNKDSQPEGGTSSIKLHQQVDENSTIEEDAEKAVGPVFVSQAYSSDANPTGNAGSDTLWLLFAFLLFPVAPAVFWLSVIMGNQRINVSAKS